MSLWILNSIRTTDRRIDCLEGMLHLNIGIMELCIKFDLQWDFNPLCLGKYYDNFSRDKVMLSYWWLSSRFDYEFSFSQNLWAVWSDSEVKRNSSRNGLSNWEELDSELDEELKAWYAHKLRIAELCQWWFMILDII